MSRSSTSPLSPPSAGPLSVESSASIGLLSCIPYNLFRNLPSGTFLQRRIPNLNTKRSACTVMSISLPYHLPPHATNGYRTEQALDLPRHLTGETKPFTPENPIEIHAQSATNWIGRAPGIYAGGQAWWNNAPGTEPRVWAYGMQRWGPQPFRLEVGGMTNKLNPHGEARDRDGRLGRMMLTRSRYFRRRTGRGFPYGAYRTLL